jgi:hypothetical protein
MKESKDGWSSLRSFLLHRLISHRLNSRLPSLHHSHVACLYYPLSGDLRGVRRLEVSVRDKKIAVFATSLAAAGGASSHTKSATSPGPLLPLARPTSQLYYHAKLSYTRSRYNSKGRITTKELAYISRARTNSLIKSTSAFSPAVISPLSVLSCHSKLISSILGPLTPLLSFLCYGTTQKFDDFGTSALILFSRYRPISTQIPFGLLAGTSALKPTLRTHFWPSVTPEVIAGLEPVVDLTFFFALLFASVWTLLAGC